MELLELAECFHYVLVLGEFLRSLAEGFLGLEVLLEIEVAKVAVDLDHVVELLDIVLICIVDIPVVLCGNGADSPPAVLDVAEGGERGTYVLLFLDEGLELLDDALLGREVVLAFLFKLAVELGAFFLVIVIQGLETGFDDLERIVLHGIVALGGSGLLDGCVG